MVFISSVYDPHMDNKSSSYYEISSAEAAKICKIIWTPSRRMRWLYDMIRWWARNQNKIHTDPIINKKCNRMLLQLTNYREDVNSKTKHLKQCINFGIQAYKEHGPESNKFKEIEKSCGDAQRALIEAETCSGHYIQALITKWFYESNCFTITDIEVKDDNYDFDLEIADELGNKYDAEIWRSTSKYNHALQMTAEITGIYQGKVHSCSGIIPPRFSDVASTRNDIREDFNFDLPKINKKMKQMRDDHVGFLIVSRDGFNLLPVDSGNIPRNKCMIVLCHISDWSFGKRGFGYTVHRPNFEHVDVAIKIIRSLKFTYEQDWHNEKFVSSRLQNPIRVGPNSADQRSLLHLQIRALNLE